MITKWGVLWRSENKLDGGKREYLMWQKGQPLLFRTRREARQYINDSYGYIRDRIDLQEEPHGWKMPKAVKVKVEITLL